MVTENVNIRFVESGARVIKRRIDEIGQAANSATRGIFLLQRAIFVLGGAGIARGLQQYADALTNMENRLRLTTTSTENLEAVQQSLFDVAIKSRSSWKGTADIYNRIALSARQLGVGQKQVLEVVETLNKAAILSGASAREANAALIQLGQGLASNRLSGDELRSVLEQLPFVADLIVNFLNNTGQLSEATAKSISDLEALKNAGLISVDEYTRGSLRELGKAGKLTSEIIFRAISSSQEEVNRLFGQTDITIEQALENAKTRFADFLDGFEDAFKVSNRIAILIDNISKNFDILLAAVLAVSAAFTGLFAAKALASISAYLTKIQIIGGALARLRSIQAASAATQATQTAAVAADTRARVANLTAITARSGAQLRAAQAEYAEATAAFTNGRARDTLTGRFIANAAARDRLTAASIRLANAERINLGLTNSLTAARTASTAADNAAAAAATRAGAAQAARSGILARLSATFPLLAGAARLAAGAVSGLFAILAANPIGAVVAAIVAAGIALFTFGDRIKVTADGVVSLKDAAIAAFQLIAEAISPVTNFLQRAFGTAVEFVGNAFKTVFSTILTIVGQAVAGIIDGFTLVPRIIVGIVAGIIAAWDTLPAALGAVVDAITDFFATGFENIANLGVAAVNKIIDAFNSIADSKVGELLGLEVRQAVADVKFDGLRTNFGGSGREAGKAFTTAFNNVVEGGRIANIMDRFGTAVIERARQNIAAEELSAGQITDSEVDPNRPGAGGGSGSKNNTPDFSAELAQLQQKIDLEKQYGIQKEITNNILSIEKTLKRELTQAEAEQVAEATRLLEISKIQGEVLQEILGPQETLRFTQAALNELFAEGAINLEQYNTKLRETQIAADRAANSLGGGFRAAIASSIQSAGQFGEALGGVVVNAANSAADAIVEFAKTGKFNIRQFFQDLFAQLLKLAAQRLLLQFIGGFFGAPGAGLAGFSQGGSILPSFAGGGSINPTGPGSTDSQLVAFNKRPDERVDILTPGQQAAQRNNQGGGMSNTTVNTTTNVAAVLSPSDIVSAFDGQDGETVIVNMIQRNASTVRQIIGN